MALQEFEKLFVKININSKENIFLLGEEALKAGGNGERLSIVVLIFKSTSKILISFYLCDFLIQKSKE